MNDDLVNRLRANELGKRRATADRIEELEGQVTEMALQAISDNGQAIDAYEAQKLAEAERDAAVAAAYKDAAKWAEKERQTCNAQGDRAGAVAYRRLCVLLSALTPADGVAALERVRREARNEALVEALQLIPNYHDDHWIESLRAPHFKRALAVLDRSIRAMMEDDDT